MNSTVTPEMERLHAYVDDQLFGEARLEVEAYLAEHPEEKVRVSDYQQINALLKQLYDPILEEPVPPELLLPKRPRWYQHRFITQMAAAVVLLAIGLFSGLYLGIYQIAGPAVVESEAEHVIAEAVTAYSVYTPEVRHPVEVSGDQRDHLVGWLSKRIGHRIVAPHLENLNMQLLGGRLLASDDGPGALLMYEDPHGKRIVLYVCITDEKSTAFHYAKQQNVSVFYWVDNSLNYAIAGEMTKDDLQPLAESVYNQIIF